MSSLRAQISRWVFCGVVLSCCTLVLAEKPGEKTGDTKRIAWTTSKMVGAPEPPPPYKVQPAFPKLKFARPVLITNVPATDRLIVADQSGKVFSFPNDPKCDKLNLALDLKLKYPKLTAIYGLAFHPNFEENRYVYICYVDNSNTKSGSHVSRFVVSKTDPPTINAKSEKLLITWFAGGHNGGCLKFGPDGYLYISTGDGSGPSPPDSMGAGQDVSNLMSSILRIDVDHQDAGKPYRVPADNPFVELEGARPEIWSYGYRNPWKMSFDFQTGDLWVGDVGWELWEMIFRVQKGGNYGWSVKEGPQDVHPEGKRGPTPILPPTIYHPHSEAASITGGFVYRGSRLKELQGAYIYGDYQTGIIWGARMEGDKVVWHEELARTPLRLVGFGEDKSGELFLLDYQQSIYRLVKNPEQDNSKNFPRKLSETGLFTSLKNQTPAPGVVPYKINAESWADHTTAQRWLAIPDNKRITISEEERTEGIWDFPDGTVVAKTVSIEFQQGVAKSARRLETQILHRESSSWRPYTYVWNDAQTEATLADSKGFSRELKIQDAHAPDGMREQTYRFAARSECIMCHNPWVEARTTVFGVQSASLLGLNALQLNRDRPHGNQLQALIDGEFFDEKHPATVKKSKKLANPYDESADLESRARAYLHVNCAHCHQFNAGGAATITLSHDIALKNAKLIDVRPTQGTFGISDAKIISPGDPLGSVLFYRISKLGGGRMPRVGTGEVDERAAKLFYDWIGSMKPTVKHGFSKENVSALKTVGNGKTPAARAQAINSLTSSTRGALALLRLVDDGGLPDPVRSEIVALTKNHAASEVRDLFERFVPVSERIKRLGTVVNQAEILYLEPDIERGKQVFFNNTAAACKNCHRIQKTGENLGPDLTQIGKKYKRGQLLKHILEPSSFMEPKYVPYLVETVQGKIYAGLLEKQSDTEVVLKDAKNKLQRFAADDVELLVRQQKSLMPELLLRDMTKQQVADLLAYLSSLK